MEKVVREGRRIHACWPSFVGENLSNERNRNTLKRSQKDYTGLHNKKLTKIEAEEEGEGRGKEGRSGEARDSKATSAGMKGRVWEVWRVRKSRAKLQGRQEGRFRKSGHRL